MLIIYCSYVYYHMAKGYGEEEAAETLANITTMQELRGWNMKKLPNVDKNHWMTVRPKVLEAGNIAKFSQLDSAEGRRMCYMLLRTDPGFIDFVPADGTEDIPSKRAEILVSAELNFTWGVGFLPEDALDYKGAWYSNTVGHALMSARLKLLRFPPPGLIVQEGSM